MKNTSRQAELHALLAGGAGISAWPHVQESEYGATVLQGGRGEHTSQPAQGGLGHTAWFRQTAQPSDPQQNPSLLQSHMDPSPCKWNFFS